MNTPQDYDEQEFERDLKSLPLERQVDYYHMLLYLQWREGGTNENATVREILHGAWSHHIWPVRHFYTRIEEAIGNAGIVAMSATLVYCMLLLAYIISGG